jgi:hypothetical protein
MIQLPLDCSPTDRVPAFLLHDGTKLTEFWIKEGILYDDLTHRLEAGKAFTLNFDGLHWLVRVPDFVRLTIDVTPESL